MRTACFARPRTLHGMARKYEQDLLLSVMTGVHWL